MVHFTVPPLIRDLFANAVFPKSKNELIAYAREQGLPEDVLAGIENMPDHIFGSLDDFMLAWGFRSEFQTAEADTPVAHSRLATQNDAEEVSTETEGEGGGEALAPAA